MDELTRKNIYKVLRPKLTKKYKNWKSLITSILNERDPATIILRNGIQIDGLKAVVF